LQNCIFREKNVDALEKQVKNLIQLVDQTVASNGGACYTNQMYLEAEAELKRKEEEKRKIAEAKKQEEINQIKAECRADMDEQIKRVEAEHKAAMDKMREEHRAAIAAASRRRRGLFGKIGGFIDDVFNL
jgi:hypothetical protein